MCSQVSDFFNLKKHLQETNVIFLEVYLKWKMVLEPFEIGSLTTGLRGMELGC